MHGHRNIKFHILPTQCFSVLYCSENKQRLFPYTLFTVLVFITDCVYCAVWTKSLKLFRLIPSFKVLVMFQGRPLTAELRFRFQGRSRDICGGQNSSGTRLIPSISLFPCQYQSKHIPYSSSFQCCFYAKEKWPTLGNLPKSNALKEIGENWKKNTFILISFFSSLFLYIKSAVLSPEALVLYELFWRDNVFGLGVLMEKRVRYCPAVRESVTDRSGARAYGEW
jgi:hypothetical protein